MSVEAPRSSICSMRLGPRARFNRISSRRCLTISAICFNWRVQSGRRLRHDRTLETGSACWPLVLTLWACSQTQEPNSSSPQLPPSTVSSAESAAQAGNQIETAVVDFKPVQPELLLVGKVAYGEDRYSKISSPLQGRVVEVRARSR